MNRNKWRHILPLSLLLFLSSAIFGNLEHLVYITSFALMPRQTGYLKTSLDIGSCEMANAGYLDKTFYIGEYNPLRLKRLVKPAHFQLVAYHSNQVQYHIKLPVDSLLVFNELFFPGWSANSGKREFVMQEVAEGLKLRTGEYDLQTFSAPRDFFAGSRFRDYPSSFGSLGSSGGLGSGIVALPRRRSQSALIRRTLYGRRLA